MNADEIAAFLNTANPDNWPLDEMQAMMRDHLGLTTQEAVARLTGDFAADIAAYDSVHEQAMEMADMLSTGIIAQFPSPFPPLTSPSRRTRVGLAGALRRAGHPRAGTGRPRSRPQFWATTPQSSATTPQSSATAPQSSATTTMLSLVVSATGAAGSGLRTTP